MIRLDKIAQLVDGKLAGNPVEEISRVAKLDRASGGDLAFLLDGKRASELADCDATCVLVPKSVQETPKGLNVIRVEDPKLAFVKIAELVHARTPPTPGTSEFAVISESARVEDSASISALVTMGPRSVVGAGTRLHEGVKIGSDVKIGRNCEFFPNVVIEDSSEIHDNVILHSGVIIGSDGFGYVRDKDVHRKFPQIGRVVIERDVEIGANSCVDRGALGDTVIGEGTKIDNLVQIAHNTIIGKRVLIASQTGISGSVTIGDNCMLAGQVGIGEGAVIEEGAVLGGKSGVFPGKRVKKGFWSGVPVQKNEDTIRQNLMVRRLEKMRSDLAELRKIVNLLDDSGGGQ